jgi:hypothetical protein
MCMKHLVATKQHAYKSLNDLQQHINMFVKCTIFKSKPIKLTHNQIIWKKALHWT